MKSSDASKHHAKQSRPSHTRHASHSTKKVFDVTRPGKTPALPTSRPVIVGHKAEAQKAQVIVSGIGESPVPAAKKSRIEIKPLHSLTLGPAATTIAVQGQVAADPEDVPAGSPPVSSVPALPASPDMETEAGTPTATASPVLPLPQKDDDSPGLQPAKDQPASESEQAPAPTLGSLQSTAKLTPPEPAPSPEPTPIPTPTPEPPAPEPGKPAPPTKEPDLANATGTPPDKTPPKPEPAVPELDQSDIQDIVVSDHTAELNWMAILLLVLILLLAVVAVDVLLDADVINFPILPRTDFL